MTSAAEQVPYVPMDPAAGPASLSPYLPLGLMHGEDRVSAMGLVDSVCFFRSRHQFEIRPKSGGGA